MLGRCTNGAGVIASCDLHNRLRITSGCFWIGILGILLGVGSFCPSDISPANGEPLAVLDGV